jgi:2-polyprenyl-3-methyl-5-hydroxy-6-metoxy-1,4-benzoquinol methylase
MSNGVKHYGWKTEDAPCSCEFVAPMVKAILIRLSVRRILDVGCGNGVLCGMLKADGFDVAGTEYDAEGCRLAQKAYPDIPFFHVGVHENPDPVLGGGMFDAVVSTEVIEHLFSPQYLPQFAARVLNPGGRLVVSTPYHGFLKNLVLSLFNHWDAHHTPLWEGGHIKFWSRKTLTALLEQNGFKVIEFHGAGRVPYLWKSMILVAQKV